MILEILIGFFFLVLGGDTLVKGAVAVARKLGLSELLIGLTLVGFGTSTPELVANIQGAMMGAPDLAVGNVIGSNLANILLVLGTAAVIFPIGCPKDLLKRDGAWLILSMLLFAILAAYGEIPRMVGLALALLLIVYVYTVYKQEKVERDVSTEMHEHEAEAIHPWFNSVFGGLILAVIGMAMTIGGAKLAVSGAVALAGSMGISDVVIGMTVVALGTSLPELVTAVVAAIRKSSDVALGGVVGSNISNVLMVLGLTSVVHPLSIPRESMLYDLPMLAATTILLLMLVRSGHRLSRAEGGFFVLCYVGYMAYSVIR